MMTATERQRARFRGQVDAVYTDANGNRLKRVRYRIPESGFAGTSCGGAPPIQKIRADYILQLLWLHALEHSRFLGILELLQPGLGPQIAMDAGAGINWQGPGGAALQSLLRHAHQLGLSQYLIRATMIDSDRDQARFLDAWMNPSERARMVELAPYVLTDRDEAAEKELGAELRKWGLRLTAPPPKIALGELQKGAKPTNRLLSRELEDLVIGLAGGSGGG